jgi:hypothetical protein
MKQIEQIKEELIAFGNKYYASPMVLNAIKGDSLKELFENINIYICWCKNTSQKKEAFNAIFDNELVIDDVFLLCNCTNLTSVIIPESVTLINDCAFEDCIELTSVTIPNSVTSIGNGVFYDCRGLTSIIIPNSVTLIRHDTFAYCRGLTSIIIPNSVTSIEDDAFCGCIGLTSVIIPNSVTSIGDYAFYCCSEDLKIIRK